MTTKQSKAAEIAEVTFKLLASCQKKEGRLAKALHITVSEFRCLRVFRGERQLSIKILIERIELSGSRLTRILDSLEKSGYLVRSIDPDDRRSISVHLSKKGIELSAVLEKNYIKMHEEILDGIPAAMHGPLVNGLQNMLTALDRWLTEGNKK
ncbi:MAG: MarR family transcriptional regulator [Bacteroidota bacterium]|jgi:DNA-binding MarR family transcriptional regulator